MTTSERPTPLRILTVGFGGGPLAFGKIADALAAARAGDEIRVKPSSRSYPAVNLSKNEVWLVVDGPPLSAKLDGLKVSGKKAGAWGFDLGASQTVISGEEATVLRCRWHGDRRNGKEQVVISGRRARLGHFEISDSTSAGLRVDPIDDLQPVIFRGHLDNFRGSANDRQMMACGETGNTTHRKPKALFDTILLTKFDPTKEIEALSVKSSENTFQFVWLLDSKKNAQLSNRHGERNTYFGCGAGSKLEINIRDQGNRIIACGGAGTLKLRSGDVSPAQWDRLVAAGNHHGKRVSAGDVRIVGCTIDSILGEDDRGTADKVLGTILEGHLGSPPAIKLATPPTVIAGTTMRLPSPIAPPTPADVGPMSTWFGIPAVI
jgi:hypothetical protein